MRRPASFSLLLLLGAASLASSASAETDDANPPEPPVAIAVFASAVTAFVPLVFGGLRAATAPPEDFGARNVGYAVAGVGPALSPIVGHAILGEWARAAAFGAPGVASEIGLSAYFAAKPDAVFNGTVGSRTAFAALFSIDIFGAAVGIVDVVMARERWRARKAGGARASDRPSLSLSPYVSGGAHGLALGGTL